MRVPGPGRTAPGGVTKPEIRAAVLLALLLAGCQKGPASAPVRPAPTAVPAVDLRSAIGVAVQKSDRACLDIRDGSLAAGRRLRFVTSSTPQTAGELEITGPVDQACSATDQTTPGLHHYGFKVVSGSLPKSVPAFALSGTGGTLTTGESLVTVDLDGDGAPESFRACTSTEGVHLTVWTGEPLKGRRRWHTYYYLGYDVEPSCTEADTRADGP